MRHHRLQALIPLLATSVALVSLASPARAWTSIEDHLPAFLVSIGEGSPQAWASWEAANAQKLDAMFYRGLSPAQKLLLARKATSRGVPVPALAYFSQRWQADFETVARRLAPLTGLADLRVSMWYTMDGRPWVFSHADGGQPTLAFNARHLLPYHPVQTRLRFSQALFDALAAVDAEDQTAERMTFSRRIQVEGLRLAMARQAVPGLPLHTYMGASAFDFHGWQAATPAIARAMLAALDGPESALTMEHFFGKGYGMPWPPGSGRYMAFILASGASQARNPVELGRMPSRDYLFTVRNVLEDLASSAYIGGRPPL